MRPPDPRGFFQSMPMIRYALLFMSGIIAGDMLPWSGGMSGALVLLGICLMAAVAAWRRFPTLMSIALMAGVAAAGLVRYTMQEREMDISRGRMTIDIIVAGSPSAHGRTVQYDAIAVSGSSLQGRRLRITLLSDAAPDAASNTTSASVSASNATSNAASASASGTAKPVLGSRQKVEAYIRPLSDIKPFGTSRYDHRHWLMSRGVTATAFVPHWSDTASHSRPLPFSALFRLLGITDAVRLQALVWRQQLIERLAMTDMDTRTLGIVSAMALGSKDGIDRQMREMYSVAGASHVLALSGIHLSVIYAVLSTLLGRARRGRRWPVIPFLWGYVVFVGMPISVIRAALMLTIFELALALHRRQHSLNSISAALFIILLFSPNAVWDVGFRLSFLAVTGIILLVPPLSALMPEAVRERADSKHPSYAMLWNMQRCVSYGCRACVWLWNFAAVSIAAQAATAPCVAYSFGIVSVAFLATNMIVVPLATVIIMLSLLLVFSVVCLPFSVLVSFIILLLGGVVHLLDASVLTISSWPWACVRDVWPNMTQVLLCYLILLIVSSFLNEE